MPLATAVTKQCHQKVGCLGLLNDNLSITSIFQSSTTEFSEPVHLNVNVSRYHFRDTVLT